MVLTDYLDAAMAAANIELIGDGTYVGRIHGWLGLLSFGATEDEATEDLRGTLEEWVLLSLKLSEELPVFGGIDLNQEPHLEPVDAL
jgi:predicted RNase H-like HicB family nuclease